MNPFKRQLTGLLPLFMFAHFGHHLVTALAVPLLPMIRSDFGLDYAQSGLLISAFSLAYGISQLPAGWLADRIGPRALITIGISGVALAGFFVGLTYHYAMMAFLFAMMGVLGGGYHPAAPPLISASVPPENRGRAMGYHMLAGSTPFFLAPLMAVAIAGVWGWRGAFITMAVPTILFGFLFYVLLGRVSENGTPKNITEKPKSDSPSSGRSISSLVPFLVLSSFTHAVTISTIPFIPLFIIDQFGAGKETAAAFLSIFYSAGLWASLLGGTLSDRIGRVPVVLGVCFVTGPLIYLLNHVGYGLGIGCLLLALGVTLYVRTPVSEAYIVGETSGKNRSTILGVYYFSNLEGSGILTPVMGFLIDRYGFDTTFTMSGAALFVLTLKGKKDDL
ncbi:MAG: MFS transporter [Deltaproteobacteria bacterium]|nr:MFS transporter [Deltaproteobacteria bacterium]